MEDSALHPTESSDDGYQEEGYSSDEGFSEEEEDDDMDEGGSQFSEDSASNSGAEEGSATGNDQAAHRRASEDVESEQPKFIDYDELDYASDSEYSSDGSAFSDLDGIYAAREFMVQFANMHKHPFRLPAPPEPGFREDSPFGRRW